MFKYYLLYIFIFIKILIQSVDFLLNLNQETNIQNTFGGEEYLKNNENEKIS